MARILISEPHADIRALLELVVRRLGHEPVADPGGEVDGLHVDAAVIEPGEDRGLALARLLHARRIPLLFTSIFPADHEALVLEPYAYLVKPFPLYALESALHAALTPARAAAAI